MKPHLHEQFQKTICAAHRNLVSYATTKEGNDRKNTKMSVLRYGD